MYARVLVFLMSLLVAIIDCWGEVFLGNLLQWLLCGASNDFTSAKWEHSCPRYSGLYHSRKWWCPVRLCLCCMVWALQVFNIFKAPALNTLKHWTSRMILVTIQNCKKTLGPERHRWIYGSWEKLDHTGFMSALINTTFWGECGASWLPRPYREKGPLQYAFTTLGNLSFTLGATKKPSSNQTSTDQILTFSQYNNSALNNRLYVNHLNCNSCSPCTSASKSRYFLMNPCQDCISDLNFRKPQV